MNAPATKEAPALRARRYLKLVEWSERDGRFVGRVPTLIGPCCHGRTEAEVMAQLSTLTEEWVEFLD